MRAVTKILFLNEEGEKFFGEGPLQLLRAVEETGSLRAAAMSMNMAYTKALKVLKNAECALGFPLTTRVTGGRDGGGSRLTPEGKAWIERYEAYRNACVEAARQIYQEYFPEHTGQSEEKQISGCVIMASGLGKRFGGNKLMVNFMGKPMVRYILEATEGLFDKRVVVTRHEDVAELCRSMGIHVVMHDLPYRSDTVRLGLEAIGPVERCVFCPADQPLLKKETVERLLACAAEDEEYIWRTRFGDTPGSPVVFPKWTFSDLMNLPEGKGGSWVLQKYPEKVAAMEVSTQYELIDVDTADTLKYLEERKQENV